VVILTNRSPAKALGQAMVKLAEAALA